MHFPLVMLAFDQDGIFLKGALVHQEQTWSPPDQTHYLLETQTLPRWDWLWQTPPSNSNQSIYETWQIWKTHFNPKQTQTLDSDSISFQFYLPDSHQLTLSLIPLP